jgi:hydroxymethylbilane synthase
VTRTIIVGTRASALALVQTEQMVAALQALHPDHVFTIWHITTHGDRVLDRSLTAIGGKGVFVKEIEDALLAGTIDLAVHSFKDLPTEQPAGLVVAAVPERADPRDVLATRAGARLADLPQGARLGTSSLRRSVQLRALRPDLQIADIRGNVDTRLRKLDEGQYDGIVLAAAGLSRLGLGQRAVELFDPQIFVPAPAQGALALEVRVDDAELCSLLAPLDDGATHAAVAAERAFLCGLGGGCDMPIGAYARQSQDGSLELRAMRADPDGRNLRYGEAQGLLGDAEAIGNELAAELLRDQLEMHDDR